MKQRIAIVIPSLAGGGVQRGMVNLSRGFVERGFAVDMVLVKAQGPFLNQLHPEVRVVDLAARRATTALLSLVNYLKRERPQAILSAQTHMNILTLTARALSGITTRVVISERTTASVAAKVSPRLGDRASPALARLFYPRADGIIAVSSTVADDLAHMARLPRARVQVVYNPIVTPELLCEAQQPVNHPWFGPDERPVVLAAGRLAAAKDFPTLIKAVSLLKHTPTAPRLLILGEGPDREKLETQANLLGLEEDCAMPGFVANPYAYMAQAAVFVLSSAWEGFANVLVESMACGTPVVATRCPGGSEEALDYGRYGRLVEVGDSQAMAAAILESIRDPLPKETLQAWAGNFSIDKSVQGYLHALGMAEALDAQAHEAAS